MTEGPQHPEQQPYPQQPYGQQPPPPPAYGEQPAYGAPGGYGGYAGFNDLERAKRPGTVVAAAVVTWIFSGLALVLGGWMAARMLADRDEAIRSLEEDGVFDGTDWEPSTLVDLLISVSVGTVLLSLAAIVFAFLALRGSSVGRIGLIVCAALGTALSLFMSTFCVGLPWLAACIAGLVLVNVGGAGDWFRSKRA